MKQVLIIFLIGLMVFKAQAQPSLDIGVFGGAGTYFGDMTKIEFSESVNPAYGAFVRYNFNPRYALRLNVFNGTIGAVGEFNNQLWNNELNPLPSEWSFDKNVMDVSLQFEFNFFKYIVGQKETPYSTYIFGGVGMHFYEFDDIDAPQEGNNNSEVSPTLPFGLGFKFNLSKRIGLGIEGGLRKTFSDKLDNLDDPLSYGIDKTTKYTDQYHNNDWTAYAGIHLVYKLFYGYKKWELTTPRDRILDWGIENNPKNR
ncbi:MAG: outer membrane beta-barrel protein [Verrucomicrobia bacterium]|nr:outer membrane beta-barrel protein [Prolixibacteraceae bacterium]